jgi:hypothetical protein
LVPVVLHLPLPRMRVMAATLRHFLKQRLAEGLVEIKKRLAIAVDLVLEVGLVLLEARVR